MPSRARRCARATASASPTCALGRTASLVGRRPRGQPPTTGSSTPELRLTRRVAGEPTSRSRRSSSLIGGNSRGRGRRAGGDVSGWFRVAPARGRPSWRWCGARVRAAGRRGARRSRSSPRDRSFVDRGRRRLAGAPPRDLGAHAARASRAPAARRRARSSRPRPTASSCAARRRARALRARQPAPRGHAGSALFGKVWYEGYAEPDYVWQSTGATDDFEPKLSLVPLIFGTIKGTLYAHALRGAAGGLRRALHLAVRAPDASRRRSSRPSRSWRRCRAS